MSRKIADYLSILVFLVVVGTVFQQIATSLTEQGIASGGPYDNAASYPRSLAIIIGLLLTGYVASLIFVRRKPPADHRDEEPVREFEAASTYRSDAVQNSDDGVDVDGVNSVESGEVSGSRGVFLLLIFGAYLLVLPYLGYQLSTPMMLGAVLILGGMRGVLRIVAFSVATSVGVSFLFEVFLNIVLPGGVFSLNIPWPSL